MTRENLIPLRWGMTGPMRLGELPSREAPRSVFAPLVVDGLLEERQAPVTQVEIAIGDVVVRTDAAIDEKRLSRVIRAVRVSQ